MTKVSRVQSVITSDEHAKLIKEAAKQKRTVSNLIRRILIDGLKKLEE